MNLPKKITGPWSLKQLAAGEIGTPKNGLKVFSCFHCGGGSSMGYKLAGYDVIGGVEIDPQIMSLYRKNHNPKHSYLMGVEEFNKIPNDKLPKELFELDILDGSPPCSSFSMAGNREDDWGKNKKFREGQAEQVLDDLFFHFIDTAKKLKPRVIIAENVKGLIHGNARYYVHQIFHKLEDAGYKTQLFVLNSSKMGVPQARERTFFISSLADLQMPKVSFNFNEQSISALSAFSGLAKKGQSLTVKASFWWKRTIPGGLFSFCGADTGKMNRKLHPNKPAWTQTATPNCFHWESARYLSGEESVRVQSFPDDYNFLDQKPVYVCGMSVPPFMMQRVALEIARQLFTSPQDKV